MLLRKQQLGRIRLWLRVLLWLQLWRMQLRLQQQLRLHPRSLLLSGRRYFFTNDIKGAPGPIGSGALFRVPWVF